MGDPRRADRICVPKREQLKEDDYPMQWFAIASIACGMTSMYFKYRILGCA
jgi:hypothetical protein